MDKVRVLLVGIGGYGDVNLRSLRQEVDGSLYEIAGVVDPFARTAPGYERLAEQGVPFFEDLEEFYRGNGADLAVLSTPIPFHKPQAVSAMRHGSHVLCEKPLSPLLQDLRELEEVQRETGKLLGVGFQWSYCEPMLALKRDILEGLFGKPLSMRVLVVWPRFDDYYQASTWKGRFRDLAGNWILDCIATNAAAHYLHNLCFLLGGRLSSSAMPEEARAAVYRGKEIGTYDTCFLGGRFPGGTEFQYIATHSCEEVVNPRFEYAFEQAVVRYDSDGSGITAHFRDGSVKRYGDPQDNANKLRQLLLAIREDSPERNTCPPEAVRPHLTLCNAVFDQVEITDFPAALRYRTPSGNGSFVRGLNHASLRCYEERKLPSELGFGWAVPETALTLSGYDTFSGKRCQ